MGPQRTPTSFALPCPQRGGPLLNADMLQRMQALERRAPLLYGNVPDRPQSRSDSTSLVQDAVQAEVARTQLVRSALRVENHPTQDAVLEYHKHLLSKFEH